MDITCAAGDPRRELEKRVVESVEETIEAAERAFTRGDREAAIALLQGLLPLCQSRRQACTYAGEDQYLAVLDRLAAWTDPELATRYRLAILDVLEAGGDVSRSVEVAAQTDHEHARALLLRLTGSEVPKRDLLDRLAILQRSDDTEAILRLLEKAVVDFPDDLDLEWRLADLQRDCAESAEEFSAAAIRFGQLANRLMAVDEPERAFVAFMRMKYSVHGPSAAFEWARIYLSRGRLDDAERAYRSLLRDDDTCVGALLGLSEVLKMRGHDAQARLAYDKARRLDASLPAPDF